jgi:TonB-linked SusC/RagA family outer membrane protein
MIKRSTPLGRVILFAVTLQTLPSSTFSQTLSLHKQSAVQKEPQKQSLRLVLLELKERYRVDIVFDDNLVNGRNIETELLSSNLGFEEQFSRIIQAAGLRYKKTKRDVYLVLAPKVDKRTGMHTFSESNLTQSTIEPAPAPAVGKEAPVTVTITGKAIDDVGNGIYGASVMLEGTAIGTATNDQGIYTLTVPYENKNGTVVFSFIGYVTEKMPINGRTVIDTKLVPDSKTLSEVVVVGYGTQLQREVTGSIGSVTAKDIKGVVVTGLDQALQGKIAGVQVTQNTGEPGGNVSVRIRGVGSINNSNEPLYIVDGVPYGSLNAINPNDIERIDVLKDAASASIYGSRGTNGVVLITTKRAKAGKITVSIDAYAGVQSAYRKLSLLNGPQFAQLANENIANANQELLARGTPARDLFGMNPAWANPSTVLNTDWQDAVLQSAPIQNYNLTLSGGSDKARSLLAIGYFKQNGITSPSSYERYTVRLNTDYEITSKLRAGVTLNGAFGEKNSVITVDGVNTGNFGALTSSARTHPTSLVKTDKAGYFGLNTDGSYNTDSTYFGYEGYAFPSKNGGRAGGVAYLPVGLSNTAYLFEQSKFNISKSQELLAAAYAEYEVIKGLNLRSSINFTFSNGYATDYQRKSPEEIQARGQNPVHSSFNENTSSSNQWNWVNTLTYSKSIDKHTFTAIAGTDALKGNFRNSSIITSGVPDNEPYINASDFNTRTAYGNPGDYTLVSYIGRLTYDYSGKYLLNANIRQDGSSNFGPNNKYGIFPSASVGWVMSEEGFMHGLTFIDQLKLRASYGTVGNQNIGQFRYLSTYSNDGGNRQYTIGAGQTPVNAYFPNNVGNPDIRWEKSIQSNFGIDASFLSNKVTLTADYFIKQISDMLGDFPVAGYTGVVGGSVIKNGFSMENKGIELTLGYDQHIGQVKFSANANFSTLENKVTKLTDNVTGFIATNISAGSGDGSAITRTAVGDRIGAFYGYVTDGIIQNEDELATSKMNLSVTRPGDRRYKDLNDDGKIDDKDRTVIGNGLPKYIFGFSLRTEFKGFDLSVLLNGQAGVQIANQTRYWLNHMRYDIIQTGLTNVSTEVLNSWAGEGTSNELPRNSYLASPNNRLFSTFNIEDGAFLRVRNVQLGYTFPEAFSKVLGMKRARVYVAAQNLFTFTQYTGYDPEIGSLNQNVLRTGVDFGRYPVPRMITGGIHIQF